MEPAEAVPERHVVAHCDAQAAHLVVRVPEDRKDVRPVLQLRFDPDVLQRRLDVEDTMSVAYIGRRPSRSLARILSAILATCCLIWASSASRWVYTADIPPCPPAVSASHHHHQGGARQGGPGVSTRPELHWATALGVHLWPLDRATRHRLSRNYREALLAQRGVAADDR